MTRQRRNDFDEDVVDWNLKVNVFVDLFVNQNLSDNIDDIRDANDI